MNAIRTARYHGRFNGMSASRTVLRCGSPHPPDTGVDELSLVLDISPEGSAAPALKLGSVDNCDYADGDGGDQQDFHGDGLISAELRRRKMWN
jgi:hypothetical protein